MDKINLNRYFRTLRKKLPCSKKQKDRFLEDLQNHAQDWIELHPNADEAAFYEAFGSPESVAESYISQMDSSELAAHTAKHSRKWMAVGIAALLFLLCAVGLAMWIASQNKVPQPSVKLPAEYAAQIGAPWSEALRALGLKESQVEEHEKASGYYNTHLTTIFCDREFELWLYKDTISNRLYGFEYVHFTEDPSVLLQMEDALMALYGTPYHTTRIRKEPLKSILGDKKELGVAWILREYGEDDLSEYQKELRELENSGVFPAINRDLALLLDLGYFQHETSEFEIRLTYKFGSK